MRYLLTILFSLSLLTQIPASAEYKMSQQNNPTPNLMADPNFKAFIEKCNIHWKAMSKVPLEEQRKLDSDFILKENKYRMPVRHIQNLEIPGPDKNKIPVRIYIPTEDVDLPILVFFHGGGWVFGGIEESDVVCRRLANYLKCMVASVGYRLAPEYPFPKPLEDCFAVTQWMANYAKNFGGDNKNIIVCGESAGGNLAAGVALMAKDKKGPEISAQLLLYPVITSTIQDSVYNLCADQYFLTKDSMEFFWSMYLSSDKDKKNPYASPDRALDFSRLPRTIMVTAEYDPLRIEEEKYVEQLKKANVRTFTKSFPGLIHGFLYISLYDEKQKVEWTKEIGNIMKDLGVLPKD